MFFQAGEANSTDVASDERSPADERRTQIAHRFGRAVKRLREASGQPGTAVAPKLGYSTSALWNLENEKTGGPPDLDRVLRVLEVFGVSPEMFWTLLEAPAQERKEPGVDHATARRLALAEAMAEEILTLVRQGRFEQNESRQEEA
jgi:transcriptional regulator with XRE-family HTH domain